METNENDASVIVASMDDAAIPPPALDVAPEQTEPSVHLFAASFPMMDAEELEALVDDVWTR